MGLLSGLGKTLDSQVDLFATIMPYAQRLMRCADRRRERRRLTARSRAACGFTLRHSPRTLDNAFGVE